jgi:hypothetical protein
MKMFTIYKMDQAEIEEIFLQFLTGLTDDEKKSIETDEQAYEFFNFDVEEEIKEELYRRAMNAIDWKRVIEKMKEDLPEEEDEESINETIYGSDTD